MAVQAQHHPSNTLMADLRSNNVPSNRARANPVNRNYMALPAGVPISLAEALNLQPNLNAAAVAASLFPVYNSVVGLNLAQQQVINGTVFSDPESELTCNVSGSRKRPREEEILLSQQQRQQISHLMNATNMGMNMNMNMNMACDFQQQQKTAAPTVIPPQPIGLVSTGLQLAYEDARLNNNNTQALQSVNTRNANPASCSSTLLSILGDDLTAHMQQHQEDIDQLIKMHNEKVRIALEEKRQRHNRALVATLEEGILRKLKVKEAEIDKMTRRNLELEERLKQLSMEIQIWQNLAKHNEGIANTLKANLEQVLAQNREQSREGRGDSEAEDAQSCCHDGDADDAHSRTLKENLELKEQRTCRVCRNNNSCILLLPCRHLCICKECDTSLETCPLCKHPKNASVQVYMS